MGDRWLPTSDDRITIILEADDIAERPDPLPTYVLRGEAIARTAKRIVRADRLAYTDEGLRDLLMQRPESK